MIAEQSSEGEVRVLQLDKTEQRFKVMRTASKRHMGYRGTSKKFEVVGQRPKVRYSLR